MHRRPRRCILIDYFNKSNFIDYLISLIILRNVTLARLNSALPDNGNYTETCWSCFNINFKLNIKTVFKTIQLCISW
jgi:hypothetical protein